MESANNSRPVSSPIHLKFEDLTVKINDKYILQNVTGEVKPGEILAIMGPSGAGKTTLLNMLCGRYNGMDIENGGIFINNQPSSKLLRRRIGYVVQEDIFLSHLTVSQTLEFVGELLIPDTLPKHEKSAIVKSVVEELSLKKCLETAMGGGMFSTGCSGGEKKRCSIAIEMIKNPGMLILDEPTSGLDAAIASNLIKSVKQLALKQNRAVITSIHQPSSHTFHLFDKLLLLCNGKVAYYGRTDGVLNFFESLDFPCYPNWNPADFILEKLTDGEEVENRIVAKYEEIKKTKGIEYLHIAENIKNTKAVENSTDDHPKVSHNEFPNGHIVSDPDSTGSSEGFVKVPPIESDDLSGTNLGYSTDDDTIDNENFVSQSDITLKANDTQIEVEKSSVVHNADDDSNEPEKWPTGIKTQTLALIKRSFIQSRKSVLDKFGFGQSFGIALATCLIWFQTPYDEDSITDRNGVCFFITVYLIFNPMFFSLLTFPPERDTIMKERSAGMYRLSAYFMAKNISELPVLILQPLLIYTLVYWGTGLNRSPVFLIGLFQVITICLLSQSIGYCFGALITNLRKCISICVVFALSCMLMGGFYTRRMPSWLTWARYLSHISHAYNIQQRLEFQYAVKTFNCTAAHSIFTSCTNGTGYITGPEIHAKYSTIPLTIAESFLVLWLYIFICRGLFYVFLRFFNRPK